ncbi:terminase small subunit [Acinetobacter sp. NIPH 2377]|uniref:terminase small subunit n=1 Tax=Acinetobacter terrestris TaxID=2529843 RepID=UPI00148F9F64|nr:terminase small subunit [Acinetobacter terrestris]NNH35731.1 terminase small subunit [Acinetobacter terrestris]
MANLTPKQQRFVEEYLIDLNATQAYIRAGFSEKLANTNAAKLLQNTTIAKAIEDARKEVSEKALITTEMVVKGLLKEAQDNSEGSTQSARVSAWAHLGKHMGMFTDKVQHSGDPNNPINMNLKVVFEDEGNSSTN